MAHALNASFYIASPWSFWPSLTYRAMAYSTPISTSSRTLKYTERRYDTRPSHFARVKASITATFVSISIFISVWMRRRPLRVNGPVQFLDLPLEIRLNIYEYAMHDSSSITIAKGRIHAEIHPLLRTNRLIRNEAQEFTRHSFIQLACWTSNRHAPWSDIKILERIVRRFDSQFPDQLHRLHVRMYRDGVPDRKCTNCDRRSGDWGTSCAKCFGPLAGPVLELGPVVEGAIRYHHPVFAEQFWLINNILLISVAIIFIALLEYFAGLLMNVLLSKVF